MTFSKLPPVFRWWDFVSFAGLGITTVFFLIYGLVHGVQGESSAVHQWPYLMSVVAAAFFFIYWRVIAIRKKEIEGFVLIGAPDYGFCVHMGDFKPGEPLEALRDLLVNTAHEWTTAGWTLEQVDTALTRDFIWIWFKPGDVDLPRQAGKVAGYTIYRQMVIGYKPGATFARTAAAHEIGHIVQGEITNVWDQAVHHQRAKELGLP